MTAVTKSFLEEFEAAAAQAETAETQYRHEAVQRIARLEQERAFAFRRLNLLKAVAGAVREAENEEDAVANGLALLRDRVNWSTVDEARSEVLSRFTPVIVAVFRAVAPAEGAPASSVAETLAEFEAWHRDRRPNPFWMLFEQQLPELPLVEV